nr:hypothetical protein CFP56_04149 [Quercus suber]
MFCAVLERAGVSMMCWKVLIWVNCVVPTSAARVVSLRLLAIAHGPHHYPSRYCRVAAINLSANEVAPPMRSARTTGCRIKHLDGSRYEPRLTFDHVGRSPLVQNSYAGSKTVLRMRIRYSVCIRSVSCPPVRQPGEVQYIKGSLNLHDAILCMEIPHHNRHGRSTSFFPRGITHAESASLVPSDIKLAVLAFEVSVGLTATLHDSYIEPEHMGLVADRMI